MWKGGVLRVLGINGTSGALYFAVADDGVPVAGLTERVLIPNELKLTSNLQTVKHSVDLVLGETKPDRVAILQGGTAPDSYNKAVARQGAETLVRMCALERGIPSEIVTRQSTAKALGIKGSLPDGVNAAIAQTGRYWGVGRKLAVAAAIAKSKAA